MDAQTCILTRRSVRKFTERKISHEDMEIVSVRSWITLHIW